MQIQINSKLSRTDVLQELVQARLGYALSRFGHRIERAAARTEDPNGLNIGCRIQLLPTGGEICAFRIIWPPFSGNSGHLGQG